MSEKLTYDELLVAYNDKKDSLIKVTLKLNQVKGEINEAEGKIIMLAGHLDQMGAYAIWMAEKIMKLGGMEKILVPRNELNKIQPGSALDDSESTEDAYILRTMLIKRAVEEEKDADL